MIYNEWFNLFFFIVYINDNRNSTSTRRGLYILDVYELGKKTQYRNLWND